jgi:hypothetical protein
MPISIGTNNTQPVVAPLSGATTATSGTTSSDASAVLPTPDSPVISPDDMGAQLAALLVKTGDQQRQADETSRVTDEKCEDAEDKSQVDALRQEAHDIRKGGLVDGLSQIGAGTLQIGGAFALSSGSKALDAGFAGAAAGAKGGGTISAAAYKGDQTLDEASATTHSANAGHAKRAADDQSDQLKNDGDLVSAAIDFYKAYSDAQAEGRSAILHRS